MKSVPLQDSAKERAEQIFGALDFNRDGELCENEFVAGCLQVLTDVYRCLQVYRL